VGDIRVAPKVVAGRADVSTCEVTIPVQRNFGMFLVKQVIMSVIVVYVGLISLWMSAADHTGDRAGLIGVSALIVMLNFQTELEIGKVPYLVWWDIFNLIAFLVLVIALAISIVEHDLLQRGQEEKAGIVNSVCRAALLGGIYPSLLLYLFIAGYQASWTNAGALFVVVAGIIVTLTLSVFFYRRRRVSTHSSRVEVVEQLKKTPISDPSFAANLLQAFSAFDWDDSGMLDVDEARDLFHVLYYEKLGSADFAKAMLIVRQYADLRGELSFDSLVDALANVASVYEIEAPRFSTLSSGGFQSRWGDLASEAKARAPAATTLSFRTIKRSPLSLGVSA